MLRAEITQLSCAIVPGVGVIANVGATPAVVGQTTINGHGARITAGNIDAIATHARVGIYGTAIDGVTKVSAYSIDAKRRAVAVVHRTLVDI